MWLASSSESTVLLLWYGDFITVVDGRLFRVLKVYKENLVETILPSIQSVMTAVLHYKKMGGEANLYINDDGLQVHHLLC